MVMQQQRTINGTRIDLTPGSVVQIEFEFSAGSNDYEWRLECLDERLELVAETTAVSADAGSPNSRKKIWLLKTMTEGAVQLSFHYFRLWEGKNRQAGSFIIRMNITNSALNSR